jgi:hypothetical protein
MIFTIAEKLACSILDGNSMAKISSKIYTSSMSEITTGVSVGEALGGGGRMPPQIFHGREKIHASFGQNINKKLSSEK